MAWGLGTGGWGMMAGRWGRGRECGNLPQDRSGVPVWRRAVPVPSEWVVSPWPSLRLSLGLHPSFCQLPALDLHIWVGEKWNGSVWGQISLGKTPRVSPCQDLGGGKGLLEFRSQCHGHCGQQSEGWAGCLESPGS